MSMTSFSPLLALILFFSSLHQTEAFISSSRIAARRNYHECSMATVAIFGGTGVLGRECVYQALQSGNEVVVLARNPSKMLVPERLGVQPLTDAKLTVIKGDVTDAADVDNVFDTKSIDSVIVALGGKTKDVGKTMLTDGTTNIINSFKSKGTGKRIGVVTTIGCGDSEKQAPMMFKALMYTVMKGVFEDKNRQEKLFLDAGAVGSDLEFCIVRPGGLGVGKPTGVINVIDGQAGSIQRADVASFLLGAVGDENFPYLKQAPCISSTGGTGWAKEKKAGFDDVSTA